MSQTEATFLARHTLVKGELHLDGPTVIAGHVEGAITAQDRLEIAAEGIVEGDIRGELVDIQGSVKGNVIATQACRLGATARVAGELRAANLSIAEGACFFGQVYVGGENAAAPEMPDDAEEEVSATQALTGAVNRIESLAAEVEEAAQHVAPPPPTAPSVSPGTPTVRVISQTVQQTLNRSPKIIKAR